MKKKLKCNVCGAKFHPKNTYVVYEAQGALTAMTKPSYKYDAIDCPNCRHQIVLGVRMPMLGGDCDD